MHKQGMEHTKLAASPGRPNRGRCSGCDVVARRHSEGKTTFQLLFPGENKWKTNFFRIIGGFILQFCLGLRATQNICIWRKFQKQMAFPFLLSWQLAFNCCAFWDQARACLIPNYAAEYYHIVFSNTAHV